MIRPGKSTLVPVVLSLVAAACGGGNDNLPPPPPPPPPIPSSLASTPAPPATEEPKAAPAPEAPVTLGKGAESPPPEGTPTVKILSPAKDQVIAADKAGDFAVKLDVKGWQTATGSQHVHLILDNKPYKAIYDPKAPVKLSELTGGEALGEGQHLLVAFPSRANHESVKTKGSLVLLPFYVGKKGDVKVNPSAPLLIYSRPKGDYKGEMASHILIDFQLAGVTLAEGKEHVAVTVTGPGIEKELTADAVQFGPPFYLDHARNGDYSIKVELKGSDGKMISGPWNSTSRTIHVDKDAPADPMPGMTHGPDPAADAGAPKTDPAKPAAKPAPKAAPADPKKK